MRIAIISTAGRCGNADQITLATWSEKLSAIKMDQDGCEDRRQPEQPFEGELDRRSAEKLHDLGSEISE